ncbi:unnamed protein product [Taenia asiatica]|uniref:Protein-tyrosine-phosphatase n=1 Tax=Taenia asiatica TaxID=60517 RepID=A0A158R9G6_TAEAS|nr:unnamed protein product [Taenia asiatica]
MYAANGKRGDHQASGDLCAEVLKNNSIRVFWRDPPKISTEFYYVELWETESNFINFNEYVRATNFTGQRFENLKAYTNYSIKVQAYQESSWILLAFVTNHTFPEKPQNLVLTNITSRSISAYWIPPEPNAESISKYMVTVLSNSVPVKSINISAPSNQCILEHLQPTTFYTVRIIACARDNDCGLPAGANAWTLPGEPRDLVLTSVTNSSIVAKWMPPERNTQSITKYIVTAVDAQGHRTSGTVPSLSKQHTFTRLQPTTLYTVSVIACARDNDCGLPANATASTLPEEPTNLQVYATGQRQLSCEWKRPRKINTVDGYQVTLYDGVGLTNLKSDELSATQFHTVFSNLFEHSKYLVSVRACFKGDKTGESICSEGINASATTNPDPLPLTIAERTASSMVYHFSPYGGYREHFNYTLRVRGRKDEVVCDATKGRCQVTGLPANSKIEASLVVCCKHKLCSLPSDQVGFTKPLESTNLQVYATGQRQLSCEWKRPRKINTVDGYQVTLYDGVGLTNLKSDELSATQFHTVFSNLFEHSKYLVSVRACFKGDKTGESICSEGINASATTNPDPLPLTIAERTASSMVYHFSPYGGYREHFNYTLRVRGRKDEVVCDATKGRCQVTGLPANSKIEASLVVCCKHKLCSLPSDQVGFTKPLAPLDLQMGSPTDATIYATWGRPQFTGEPITGYRAVAVDTLGNVTNCTPSELIEARFGCTFRGLSPCMRYHISVQTCAREDDCSLPTEGIEHTLPGTVSGLQMEQTTSTNVSFTWTPQSMEVCKLENITVMVQALEASSMISRCSVKQQEVENSCTVTGLEPNTAYIAYAVACSATTHTCANKTNTIEVETLPGVPLQINMSEVSARSVVLSWSQPSGRQDGLSGFLVRVYKRSEDERRAHGDPITNCTTALVDMADYVNTCRLDNLQPSTNYSITVTTFKRYSKDKIIFGDESEAIDFTTGRSTIFNNLPYLSYFITAHSNLITFWPKSPAPVALEQLDACIEALDSNKQFIPHFLLLKKIAVMGVEKEFHLTKNAGLQCRELNRYIDMLPYDQSIVILGRRWPRVLDDPEPKITTTELLNNYINASYIRRPIFGSKGEAMPCDPSDPPDYIATQGPMSTTAADFLTMVYEHRSKLILMLCRSEEDGKQKCKEYWDDERELMVTSATRSVNVITSNVKTLDSGLIRRTLCIIPSNKTEFENVTFVDCFNGHEWIRGILQITHAHTFFVDDSKKCELRIQTCLIDRVERLPLATTGAPLMIRGKNFRVACFLIPHDRDCQKVYETLTGLIQVPSIKQLPCFQDWPSGLSRIPGEGWNFFDLRTDFDRMGLPSSSWVALDNNYYQICDTYPSILFVPKQTDYATLLGSANFRSRKRLPVLTWVHPNGKFMNGRIAIEVHNYEI